MSYHYDRRDSRDSRDSRESYRSSSSSYFESSSSRHRRSPSPKRDEPPHVEKSTVDFSKYESAPVEASGKDVPPPISSWKDANLDPAIEKNLERAGYTAPTPIQKHSIPIVTNSRDMMGCAQTGSGKTAAFLLPILNRLIDSRVRMSHPSSRQVTPYGLILAPTRELACQIQDEARKFSWGTTVRSVVLYGGASIGPQLREVERGCTLVVATPGRLVDVLERGILSLASIRYLVLDEADRMLDMGFEPQIRRIVEQHDMPRTGDRITLMFSATFAPEVRSLAASFLRDYIFLTVGRVGKTTEYVTQRFIHATAEEEKQGKLLEILREERGLVLIFVETKKKASSLDYWLRRQGFLCNSIHGDRTQQERTSALRGFSTGQFPILIATNVAARGLDISNVAHVINYEMPNNIEDYVHRIGRTGRIGKTGVSTAFISDDNWMIVKPLLDLLNDAKLDIPEWLIGMGRGRGRGPPTRGGPPRGGYGGYSNGYGGGGYSGGYSNGGGSYGGSSYGSSGSSGKWVMGDNKRKREDTYSAYEDPKRQRSESYGPPPPPPPPSYRSDSYRDERPPGPSPAPGWDPMYPPPAASGPPAPYPAYPYPAYPPPPPLNRLPPPRY